MDASRGARKPALYAKMGRLIGFAGRKGSGKDTCAAVLVDYSGFERFAFADCMKCICKGLFDLTDEQLHGHSKDEPDDRYGHSPRQLLQMFGADFIRDMVSKDFWVEKFRKFMSERLDDDPPIVVSDVRFQNEVDVIRELGGKVYLINRRAAGAADLHRSEDVESLQNIAGSINNSWSLGDLQEAAYDLGASFSRRSLSFISTTSPGSRTTLEEES